MTLNDKLTSWRTKRLTYFYRIFSQPKSEYRPIEFAQAQTIYIHQVNNQTNLKSVATMTLCFYLLNVSGPLAVPQLPLHHQL